MESSSRTVKALTETGTSTTTRSYSDLKFVTEHYKEFRNVLVDNFCKYIENRHKEYKRFGQEYEYPFESVAYCEMEEHQDGFTIAVRVTLRAGRNTFREYTVWEKTYKNWHFTITWLATAIESYEQNNQKHIWVSQGVHKDPQEPLTFIEEITLIKIR